MADRERGTLEQQSRRTAEHRKGGILRKFKPRPKSKPKNLSDEILAQVPNAAKGKSPAGSRKLPGPEPLKTLGLGDIIGVSSATGRPVTLAEGVAAAKARVAADRLIPDARTPEAIIKLSKIELA